MAEKRWRFPNELEAELGLEEQTKAVNEGRLTAYDRATGERIYSRTFLLEKYRAGVDVVGIHPEVPEGKRGHAQGQDYEDLVRKHITELSEKFTEYGFFIKELGLEGIGRDFSGIAAREGVKQALSGVKFRSDEVDELLAEYAIKSAYDSNPNSISPEMVLRLHESNPKVWSPKNIGMKYAPRSRTTDESKRSWANEMIAKAKKARRKKPSVGA